MVRTLVHLGGSVTCVQQNSKHVGQIWRHAWAVFTRGAQVAIIFTVISRSLTVTGFLLLCTKPEITQLPTQPKSCAQCHESQAKAKIECFRAPSLLLYLVIHMCIYSHSHSHNHNHLSCRLLELPGISHRQVVPALLDPVGPRAP